MSEKFEDSLAYKAFLYTPVPGVDVAVGLGVHAAEQGARAAAEGLAGTIADGVAEGVARGLSRASDEVARQAAAALESAVSRVLRGGGDIPADRAEP